MTKEFQESSIHIEGRSDFDFLSDDQIISAGHDELLYVFDCRTMERIQNSELNCEIGAIAVHPINRTIFALGGSDQKVQTFDNQEMVNGNLIQKFSGSIHRIKYSPDGKFMAIASEENTINVFSQDYQKNSKCRPVHEGMTLNACFDPLSMYLLSFGCDGSGFLFQLSETPQFLRKYKISKDVSPSGAQILQADWNPNGKIIALPGQFYLQMIKLENHDPGELIKQNSVSHLKEISLVLWVSEGGLITVGLDKVVKLWHYKNDNDIVLKWSNTFENLIQQVKMNPSKTKLYLLDTQGTLHWTSLESEKLAPCETSDEPTKQYLARYQSTTSALQDLQKKKVNVRPNDINEELQISDESEVIDKKPDLKALAKISAKNPKTSQSELSNIIDIKPQNTLHPTKTESFRGINDLKFLLQNYIGSVKSCSYTLNEKTYKNIDVEFFDKNFYVPLKFDNDQNYEMAAMNYRGLVLASKGPNNRDTGEDGYLNDEETGEEPSKIYFQSFHKDSDYNKKNKFVLDLPNQEGAESICIGNDWFAVATDAGIFHIFGFSGIELHSFALMRPLLAVVGYENILIAAYLDSVPMFGCQMIRANIYDVDHGQKIREIDICLSLYSEIEWIGFSEEGLLISQDSKNCIWAYLFEEDRWVQVNVDHAQDKKFWLFSATEYSLVGYLIDKDDRYPDAAQQPLPEIKQFSFASVCNLESVKTHCQAIMLKQFMVSHEQFRQRMFTHLNESRLRKTNPLIKYSQSIWNTDKFNEVQKEIIKLKLLVIKNLLNENEFEKLLEYFKTHINTIQSINMVVGFIERLTQDSKLLEKMKQIQLEKMKKLESLGKNQNESEPNSTDATKKQQGTVFGLNKFKMQHPISGMNTGRIQPPKPLDSDIPSSIIVEDLQQNFVKTEEAKQLQKSNHFASKLEANTTDSIFEHLEQQQENQRKRKVLNGASQNQYGHSNLKTKQ